MEQNSKIPLVVMKNSFSITLSGKTAEALLQQPRPILWLNDGLYCWIPLARIKNIASVGKDLQKHTEANDLPHNPSFKLKWDTELTGQAKEMAQAIVELKQSS